MLLARRQVGRLGNELLGCRIHRNGPGVAEQVTIQRSVELLKGRQRSRAGADPREGCCSEHCRRGVRSGAETDVCILHQTPAIQELMEANLGHISAKAEVVPALSPAEVLQNAAQWRIPRLGVVSKKRLEIGGCDSWKEAAG